MKYVVCALFYNKIWGDINLDHGNYGFYSSKRKFPSEFNTHLSSANTFTYDEALTKMEELKVKYSNLKKPYSEYVITIMLKPVFNFN